MSMQFFGNPRKKCWKTCAERIIADESVDEKKRVEMQKKGKFFKSPNIQSIIKLSSALLTCKEKKMNNSANEERADTLPFAWLANSLLTRKSGAHFRNGKTIQPPLRIFRRCHQRKFWWKSRISDAAEIREDSTGSAADARPSLWPCGAATVVNYWCQIGENVSKSAACRKSRPHFAFGPTWIRSLWKPTLHGTRAAII